MFLSLIEPNPQHPNVHRDRQDAHRMHQRIMQAFPDELRQTARSDWRILFRVEPDQNTILVQSDLRPDWQRLPSRYLTGSACHPISPLLQQIQDGKTFQFRLMANPSKRDARTRKTVFLRDPQDQIDWMIRKGTQHGFAAHQVGLMGDRDEHGRKRRHRITIGQTLFQGLLIVQNAEQVRSAVCTGIGRGKAYGCGLFSLLFSKA